jgi:hypothetical protein
MRTKSFNTTGPCRPEMHYMLPPQDRLDQVDLKRFINEELYWVLHAPRQTGKTSFLMNWMLELNQSQDFVGLYVSCETAQGLEAPEKAIPLICDSLRRRAEQNLPQEYWLENLKDENEGGRLSAMLKNLAEKVAPKKLVILFDEVDVLTGPSMISFLRQLRDGFSGRGVGKFPVSIALVGMRDLRDYLVSAKDGISINPGSPFNIKKESYSLKNFSIDEVQKLLIQHTEATGQVFSNDGILKIFDYTQGQPWLVNTLADLCVTYFCKNGEEITPNFIEDAKEKLIKSRAVHIDSLAERLKDPRIKQIIEPLLIGDLNPDLGRQNPDVIFAMDLGLISWDDEIKIANPIYKEVLIRTLNSGYQDGLAKPEFKWQQENGDLDIDALMLEFQDFWRWHADLWEERANYTEAFPHLLLMAFFQRVLNGGARLTREVGVGRGRIDMLIEWKEFRHVFEIKLVHPKRGKDWVLSQGLKQIKNYADKCTPHTQTLVIFDRTPTGKAMSFDEKLKREEYGDVIVWWC